jgi:hypothetical protein
MEEKTVQLFCAHILAQIREKSIVVAHRVRCASRIWGMAMALLLGLD